VLPEKTRRVFFFTLLDPVRAVFLSKKTLRVFSRPFSVLLPSYNPSAGRTTPTIASMRNVHREWGRNGKPDLHHSISKSRRKVKAKSRGHAKGDLDVPASSAPAQASASESEDRQQLPPPADNQQLSSSPARLVTDATVQALPVTTAVS